MATWLQPPPSGIPALYPMSSLQVPQYLLPGCRRRFLHEPSLLDIPAGTVVVGDLHGDFLTLRRIFNEFAHPPKQRYLFLGDFVDR